MRRLLIVPLTLAASAAYAQQPAMRVGGDPVQVVQSFLDAVAQQRYSDAARLLDPEPVTRQRRNVLQSVRQMGRPRVMTVEDYMRRDSTMPRAVAEYHVAQYQRQIAEARPYSLVEHTYAGVTDTTAMLALGSLELATRWLQARDLRYEMRRLRSADPRCPPLPDSLWAMAFPRRQAIGAVEQADTAWVVVKDSTGRRRNDPMDPWSGPLLIALYRRGGQWLITPNDAMLRNPSGSFISVDCVVSDTSRTVRTRPPQ